MRLAKKKNKIKIRKSTRHFYIALASSLFVISFIVLFTLFFGGKTNKTKEEIYKYTNRFGYNYQVNLIHNKYIEETTLGMNQTAYVTDLIDNINLDLDYQYNADEKTNINYGYAIKGILNGVYTKDGYEQKILTREYSLVEAPENIVTDNSFAIKENLLLDLKEQNQLIRDFEQEIGISIDATYTVLLEVKTSTEIESELIENKYLSSLLIDIGNKTTTINGENNKEDTQYASKEIESKLEVNPTLKVLTVTLFGLSIVILYYLSTRTIGMNKTRNEFRQELNKILRLCQDKIVQVSDNLEVDTSNIINVKDFGEIVKVSEELFKPILYWNSIYNNEAWFIVMSHGVKYRYILKK